MKRRHWLTAAIASLVASTGASFALAGEHAAPLKNYNISDNSVQKASATSGYNTNNSTSNLGGGGDYCEDCESCDACDDIWGAWGSGMWYVEVEGLAWWRKNRDLPPLVTTNLGGTAPLLSSSTSRVLFGGESQNDGIGPGGRIWFGRYFGPDQCTGVAASFFALQEEEISFTRVAGPTDILGLPFINDDGTPAEDALLINGLPGGLVSTNGRVTASYDNDIMGADVYLRKLIWAETNYRIDAIGGYQFSRIDDGLRLNANYDDVAGLPNENFDITDSFLARNEFHGGTVGVLVYADYGRWTIKGIAKCGLGNMQQTIDIAGQTVITPAGGGAAATQNQGLFAQSTNIGSYSHDEFGIIPEAKINFGYRATENWTFSVGYSFIYWNDIITAGSGIDRNINLTQVPGPLVGNPVPAAPTFFNDTDFWVQGINFSAEFAF